jgi:hypothetical protein
VGEPRQGLSDHESIAEGISLVLASGSNREELPVLGRPGSDLLSQVLRLSTIGAGEFNGRVRDGIGFRLPAITTRPAKDSPEDSGNVAVRATSQ